MSLTLTLTLPFTPRLGLPSLAPRVLRVRPRSFRRYNATVQHARRAVERDATKQSTNDSIGCEIDGNQILFNTALLRDSCSCPQCVDPHSKQKLFQTSDIPTELKGFASKAPNADQIDIRWENDLPGYSAQHTTSHSIGWLRRAFDVDSKKRNHVRHTEKVLWDCDTITRDNKWVQYSEYMADDQVLLDSLRHLNQYGLLFMNHVPDAEKSVEDIVSRIGKLKDTFYGLTWDVKSKPNATNIAYTQQYLGLHMDLLYTTNPPHLQLLHSLRARTPGGSSLFSDSFRAANILHRDHHSYFRALRDFPVTYHYHNDSQHYHFTRPTISLIDEATNAPYARQAEAISHINWSPPFQAPFEQYLFGASPPTPTTTYLAAAKKFAQLIESKENLFELRLEEGQCVIFDNRRVLHARKAFDASKGERWLKGAYVDDDVFFSRLRVLEERLSGRWVADGILREAI